MLYRQIVIDNISFGFIIRKNSESGKTSFITDQSLPLQFAYMNFNKGDHIKPHIHNQFSREILTTNEVIIVKNGSVVVNFFDFNKNKVGFETLLEGDIIFLQEGGHSFDFLENTELFEVKNGPYFGQDMDKSKF